MDVLKNQKKWLIRTTVMFCMLLLMFSVSVLAASPKLNKTKLTLNVGDSYTLVLKNYKGTASIQWKSSNSVKATVSQTGRVVARKAGKVKITAVVGKKKYNCTLTIKQQVTKIKLSSTSLNMVDGDWQTLTATALPTTASNRKVKWTSSNTAIAKVTSSGRVKAVDPGTAVITATAKDGSGVKAVCQVTIIPKENHRYKDGNVDISGVAQMGQSLNASKFLACLKKMSDQVKKDYNRGRAWVYGETNNRLWEKEVAEVAAGGKGSVVCSEIVRYALTEAGIFTPAMHMYAKANGTFKFNKYVLADPDFDKKYEIIKVNKTAKQLAKEGKLLPGDICSWSGVMHTNIYAGNNKWYDAGRGANTVYKNGQYQFKSFGPSTGWSMNNKIVYIVRLK